MRIDGFSSGAVTRPDPAQQQAAAEAARAEQPQTETPAQPASPPPGQTLSEMARQGPQLDNVAARQAGPVHPASEASFADQVRGTTQQPIDLSMAQMANDVYSTPDASGKTNTQSEAELAQAGWHRVQPGEVMRTPDGREVRLDPAQLTDRSSGFEAAVYQNDKGHVVVAFAGTNPKSPPDLITDAGQGLGLNTRQYELAARMGVKMAGIFGAENVAFTGHSLGGGLAATATLASGAQGVTFNAAGLSNETLREYGSPNGLRDDYASNGALRSYSVAGDPLTVVGHAGIPHPIGTELQMPNVTGSRNPITVHGGGGDNQLYVEGLREGQAVPTPGASLPDRMNELRRQAALNTLGTVVNFGAGLFGDTRQIGAETLRDIAGTVRQPDLFTPSRVVAELVDGGLQATGAVADRALDGLGREATVITDAAGQATRELLRGTRWEGRAEDLATRIESSGEVIRGALDGAGNAARHVAGRAGDLVSTLPDRAKDVASTAVSGGAEVATTAWAGARDVGRTALDGGRTVVATGADAVADTARSAVTGASRVASTAVEQARDGARALGEGNFGQAARTALETPVKMLSTAARETVRHLGVVASEARAVVSSIASGAADVARQAVSSGREVVSTALDKAGEVASKLNPFKWSF
jgi:hypothetical protein